MVIEYSYNSSNDSWKVGVYTQPDNPDQPNLNYKGWVRLD